MSISEISPIGLPSCLKYDSLPSIPDGVKGKTQKKQDLGGKNRKIKKIK